LRELFQDDPSDVVSAVYLADLEKRALRPLESAKVLSTAAAALSDLELGASLHLEAALLLWRSGERRVALDELESALLGTSTPVAPLFAWALRGIDAASSDERRRLLDRAAEFSEDGQLLSLQRFALRLFTGNADPDTDSASELLESIEAKSEAEIAAAGALARIVWDEKGADRDGFLGALQRLAEASPKAQPITSWENLRMARLSGEDRALAAEHAQAFAQTMGTLPANLEWLGAAIGAGNREAEVQARRTVAAALSGEARSSLLAGASLVALLHAPAVPQPLLTDTDAQSRLMNLELAGPGSDGRKRASALFALGDALGDEAMLDSLVMAGYNHLALGNSEEALTCFVNVVADRQEDLFAWEGLRSAAEALGDVENQALACAELGDLCSDDARGSAFWEKAALLRLDTLRDEEQGEIALERAFARDASREVAFDRLFRRVRQRGDPDKLLTIVARRLEVAEDPEELAKLFWERARVLRQKGDRPGALSALENVTMIEPDHVGALALKGEIDITQSNFEGAAKNLARLSMLDEAPAQQRLMSGVAAVDLYENKLHDTAKALEVLVGLHRNGLSTLPVRERMARAAAKTGSWDHATSILEELMNERSTPEGRIEAARLAMAIWRDKKGQPLQADKAASKLLYESPEDGEALDLFLENEFPDLLRNHLLVRGRVALIDSLAEQPVDETRIARLTKIAQVVGDLPLRQATLGALHALIGPDSAIQHELLALDRRVARIPQNAVDDATVGLIGDPDDTGALPRLFAVLAEGLSQALGPSLEALGVGKKQKLDPRSGLPIRNEIAAWAGALGLGDFDVYIGGTDTNAVQGVAGEVPALVVGSGVSSPLTPAGRQAIVRELFALRRGISVTRTRDETTIAAIVVAACNIAEVRIESPPYAMLNDVQRQLGKALSRRTRKMLPDICRAVVREDRDIRAWARAALASMYRMAAIAAGDVSLVITDALGAPLGQLPSLVPHDDRARRLIAFVLSPRYLELRGRLGMGVT
jgi:cellulose synthase operon protein C